MNSNADYVCDKCNKLAREEDRLWRLLFYWLHECVQNGQDWLAMRTAVRVSGQLADVMCHFHVCAWTRRVSGSGDGGGASSGGDRGGDGRCDEDTGDDDDTGEMYKRFL